MTTHQGLPSCFQGLRLPVMAAPMFTVSYPELVLAQCRAGIIGSFPALNARPAELLADWLSQLADGLRESADAAQKPAAYAVNLIVNNSNSRLEKDIRTCIDHKVPVFITSLRAPPRELIDEAHAYGGIVVHDVVNRRHAEKALEAGVDGLILVAAGAGGHAGMLSPFALLGEIRTFYDGLIGLSGAISTGSGILAAQAMGADFAYIGTRFIATVEAQAAEAYKATLLEARAGDIVYTNHFTGVHGNYLKQSIVKAGLDPLQLGRNDGKPAYIGPASRSENPDAAKTWKDIWGAGQGVGMVNDIPHVAELIERMADEYFSALRKLQTNAVPASAGLAVA